MSTEFITYDIIAIAACLITLAVIRPRNAFDLSRCVGWYLLIFLATYILRPSLSEFTGDLELYQALRIGSFEDHWQLMTIAVPLAIITFGIGYAVAAPSRTGMPNRSASAQNRIDPHKVRILIFILISLGYFALAVGWKTGAMDPDTDVQRGLTQGVYTHNTAWFAQDDLFISTGSILYYILTKDLGMSLLLSAPWMMFRIIYGWGRSHLLGHFFSLMAVYYLGPRTKRRSGTTKSMQVTTIGLAMFLILALFPLMSMVRGLRRTLNVNSIMSKDVLRMVAQGSDSQDLIQSYMGTNSSITGFEQTLSHLLTDSRSEMGVTYLYCFFLKPIPRIVWPGKGTSVTWVQRLRGIDYDPFLALISAASGSIGFAYREWGWLGIPFEFLFTGWVLRKAEETVRRRVNRFDLLLAYAGLYGMLPQLGRDTLLYMIANFWLFQFGLPVFILWRMHKGAIERSRHKAAATPPVAPDAVAPVGKA
jgi:hypothetical protein